MTCSLNLKITLAFAFWQKSTSCTRVQFFSPLRNLVKCFHCFVSGAGLVLRQQTQSIKTWCIREGGISASNTKLPASITRQGTDK
jgi:hypothetical protein